MNGIHLMDAPIATGQVRRGLVVTGDRPSAPRGAVETLKATTDRDVFVKLCAGLTLGDAGAAVVLGPKLDPDSGFMGFMLQSQGRYFEVSTCGKRCRETPLEADLVNGNALVMQMLEAMYAESMAKFKWRPEQIAKYVHHQAGVKILKEAARYARISPDIVVNLLPTLGNMATANIPVILDTLMRNREVRAGEKVFITGVGSGLVVRTGSIWDALATEESVINQVAPARAPGRGNSPGLQPTAITWIYAYLYDRWNTSGREPTASLPAVLALLFKGGIFTRAIPACAPADRCTSFLFALSIQNLAEISYFYRLGDDRAAEFPGTVFYAAGILALALFFHLALALARDDYREGRGRTLLVLVYLAAGALELLLLFTPWLVAGFERVGWSVARVPGPLYAAFEVYAAGTLLAAIGLLLYGARRQPTPQRRMRNAYVLLGVIPMVAIVLAVLTLLHLGAKWINTSVILPAAMGVFLLITAYATHQHRLFDIQFYIPWSRGRQRKTAFYRRLHAMVAEVADLGSVNELLNRLADTLRCPVALLSGERLTLAQTAGARTMVQIPALPRASPASQCQIQATRPKSTAP